MSLIHEKYRKDGFDYVLVRAQHFPHRRVPEVLGLYEQYREGRLINWEVVRCRWHDEVVTPGGVTYPPGFKMPSSTTWGQHGWTYKTRKDADSKFDAVALHLAESITIEE